MWPRDDDGNWDGGDGCSTVPSIVVELTWEELVYLESVAKNFRGKKAVVSSSLPYTLSSYLVATLVEMPVVQHTSPTPSTGGWLGFWFGLGGGVDAGAAVEAGGVGAGALHRAHRPSRSLLLHQLPNNCFHRLCSLRKIGQH